MSDDIHLMIEALESYTGLPWDYLKIAHPSIEKLFKRCADIISRDDLIEISKTICDRCTMGDKLCDAIMNLLSAQPDLQPTCNQLATDCISRQAAIDAFGLSEKTRKYGGDHSGYDTRMLYEIQDVLEGLPSAQPETHGKRPETHACDCISRQAAIDAANRTDYRGLLVEDVTKVTDEVVKELKKLPSAQPEINCSEIPNSSDTISRQLAIDVLDQIFDSIPMEQTTEILTLRRTLRELPSAQAERTCVNCGRTVNNGGWYADGGTRCPIEEHYALPKNGYCHLWEERNVTDDDYPERREE